jgi:NAD(P)-dependent dehydrogenase (short-subunit alcohol dehydrogenase family)
MKSAVITGVSTGIGEAAARSLVGAGYHVFGSVRRVSDAESLSRDLGGAFTPLVFDVTDPGAVRDGAAAVKAALGNRALTTLVNNAGIAVAGPLLHLPLEDFRRQMEVNLTGVLTVTQAFGPLLCEPGPDIRTPRRILNISSVAGRTGNPFMGPYSASKFALEGLSQSLRRELLPFGVDVIVIAPGAVQTPIWKKGEEIDLSAYGSTPYRAPLERLKAYMIRSSRSGLPAERLGALIAHAATTRRPRPRYSVTPDPVRTFLMEHVLPKRVLDRIIGRALGLLP